MIVYNQQLTNGIMSYPMFKWMIFVYMMFLMSVLEPPMILQLTGYNIGFSIEFYL